ncbi:MAG: hypothetical protein M0R03_19550 [Novosphingobium sp.]|nr:hypothetical protein [Novosphingobium sp.]
MKKIYMDDVNNTTYLIIDKIKEKLDIEIDSDKEDELFNEVQAEIDKLCGFPEYNSYN